MWLSFLTVVAFLLLVVLVKDTRKPNGFPPGPKWMPLVGNFPLFQRMLSIFGFTYLVWEQLAALHGPVVGLRLGRIRVILVSGRTAIREVLTREEFDGRPDGFFFKMRTFGKRLGIVFVDGHFWQEQRRFCLKHLRNFGFGRRDMEDQISQESIDLVASLKDSCSRGPVLAHNAFDICVLNVLWAMIAGERFSLDDERLKQLLQIVHDAFRLADMSGGLLNQMPLLRFVIPAKCGYTQHMDILRRMWTFLETTIDDHQSTLCPNTDRDLIDAFLHNMAIDNTDKTTYTREQLLSLCLDLFMAGSETTSNTLGFAILYMIRYPEIQRKVQAELDTVVGRNRMPSFQDRSKLNYTEAVLMEIQRHGNIVPVGIAHRAMKQADLLGHTIPEGTTLLINFRSLHNDPHFWSNPNRFQPERFLDNDGNLKRAPDDCFAPFGFGRRRCLGETLAKSSMFLFFTAVLHNFEIKISEENPLPYPEAFDGVTISPKPFYAKFKFRNE